MALPSRLMDEIFCRLPVKPLLVCRCVSKGWCSLIDSPAFIKKHLKTTLDCNIGGGLLINGGDGNFYLADFDSLDDPSASVVELNENDPLKTLLTDAQFVGASNGFICVFKNEMNDVFLINPTTRKSKKIARSPPGFPTSFSPFENSMCGFGYDQVNDDYKVVKIAECYNAKFRGIMAIVFSLKTNAWTRIQNVPDVRFSSNRGIFASGSLHWTASRDPANLKDIILGFDLELQQFKEVPHIPSAAITRTFLHINWKCLVAIGGCLAFTDNYPNSGMDVWMMKNYGAQNSWYKALSVEQRSTLGSFQSFSPVAFSKSHKYVLLEVDGAKLVWYDLEKKKVKKVRIRGIPVECHSFLYTESLLQLTEDEDKPLQQKPAKDKHFAISIYLTILTVFTAFCFFSLRDEFLSKEFNLKL